MTTQTPSRRFFLSAGLVATLLWGLLVLELTEFVQYSRNTLVTNGAWVSSKPFMKMQVMGGGHFPTTRNALRGNQLNLAEWHAFNEVHYREAVRPATIDYRFRLDPLAYLDFIFERDEAGHGGIRLSRDDRFPTCFYRADRASRFLGKAMLDLPQGRLGDGWHDLRLSFGAQEIQARLDGVLIGSTPTTAREEPSFVGLRGGMRPSAVTSIRITGPNGDVLLDEDFRNRRQRGAVMAVIALLSLGVALLAPGPFSRRGLRTRAAALSGVVGLAVALVLVSLVFAFDFTVWSARYPYAQFLPGGRQAPPALAALESLRARFFRVDPGPYGLTTGKAFQIPEPLRRALTRWDGTLRLGAEAFALHRVPGEEPRVLQDDDIRNLGPKPPRTLRLGFLGSSQTKGTGAEMRSDTFVGRIHALLAPEFSASPFEVYNFSIAGSNSRELTKRFMEVWRAARLDLLVVNLANNDTNAVVLTGNLRTLALEMKREGGEIVFLLEANSVERNPGYLSGKHAAVRRLGEETGAPVFDLHGYLASDPVYDSGVLWWDHVHLSSYGQSLAAEWLAERLRPLLHRRQGQVAVR